MNFKAYFNKTTDAAPLAFFRIGFGVMMFFSIVRFVSKGWVNLLYIQPKNHFTYYGFEWVKPLGVYTYLLFVICGLSALFIAFGYKYRFAIIIFFLSFTYIELMDKTTYLNHYYFISLMSFIMIFLPANAYFSIDNLFRKKAFKKVPNWTIDSVKLLLGIVYFYAGLAKINSDWLLRAMPLKIWLPSKYDLPFIGDTILQQEWLHYAMSWGGMLYDLFIPFLLLYKRTRIIGFLLVVFFHVFTRILFPIGMFPYIMIVSSIIFFDARFHHKIINFIKALIQRVYKTSKKDVVLKEAYQISHKKFLISGFVAFFCIQILFPFRYLTYPGELFWTEEGFRFSWRVMLMEKMGHTNFKIVDGKTDQFFYINNADFLTEFQEKQMSFQPDFILEYAHILGDHYKALGHENVEVYVDCYVGLNGRLSTLFINPEVNLYKEKESLKHKNWILPFKDEIKGL